MDGELVISLEDAQRIRSRIVRVVALANFVAAAVMFCLLNLALGREEDGELWQRVVSFLVVSALAFPCGALLGLRLFRPVERWLREARPPTEDERALVLGAPRLVAALAFAFWVVTAAIIGVVELVERGSWLQGGRQAATLLAAGVTSAALSFLLVERRVRPLAAVVLAGRAPSRSRTLGLRPRLVMSWALGSGVPLFAIAVGEISVGADDPRVSPAAAVIIAGVGLAVGALMTVAAVRSVAEPIAGVRDALAAVEGGDLSARVVVDDAGEIGQLQAGMNRMTEGLRERQQLADLFGRHVGSEVAQRALREGVRLGGERREASALFVDLRDSTALAASSPPEEVVSVLNRFFEEVVRAVDAEGGSVNKFEGDGAMCIFGAPAEQADHATRALRAARTLHERLEGAGLRAAIGVSSGEVVAGNVGAHDRYEYTVIGDPVNEAARLTEAAKRTSDPLLASGPAVDLAGAEGAHWELVDEVQLRGRLRPTGMFRPIAACSDRDGSVSRRP